MHVKACHAARMMPALVSIVVLGPWSLVWGTEPSNHILDTKEYDQTGWAAEEEDLQITCRLLRNCCVTAADSCK